MFSYNLYPGPSAKKGVYGMLLDLGEQEQWVTLHASVVRVVTPYDNKVTIIHEGATGGGKSEMLEHMHRERDGRILLGVNTVSGEERHVLVLPRGCELHPVADDMALCHPSLQRASGKLGVMDAEKAWFVRLNHITRYGTDPVWRRARSTPRSRWCSSTSTRCRTAPPSSGSTRRTRPGGPAPTRGSSCPAA